MTFKKCDHDIYDMSMYDRYSQDKYDLDMSYREGQYKYLVVVLWKGISNLFAFDNSELTFSNFFNFGIQVSKRIATMPLHQEALGATIHQLKKNYFR